MKYEVVNLDPRAFLKTSLSGLLLYGSESEVMTYLIENIRDELKSFHVPLVSLEAADFFENFQTHMTPDLFSGLSALGGRRFFMIEEVSEKHFSFYQKIFSTLSDTFLILTSSKMRASSPFLQWAQKSSSVAAVGCYPLETGAKNALLQKTARRFNLRVSPDILKVFAPYVPIGELSHLFQLLSLYAQGPITQDVLETCWGHLIMEESDLAYALSGRNALAFYDWTCVPHQEVLSGIRQSLKHFIQMVSVKSALKKGEGIDQALSRLSPPVFFKQLPVFKKHLTQWSLLSLEKAIYLLTQSEIKVKKAELKHGYVPLLNELMMLPVT